MEFRWLQQNVSWLSSDKCTRRWFSPNNTRYDYDNGEQEKKKLLIVLIFLVHEYIFLGKCHKSLHGLPVSKTRNAIDGEWNKEFQHFFFLSFIADFFFFFCNREYTWFLWWILWKFSPLNRVLNAWQSAIRIWIDIQYLIEFGYFRMYLQNIKSTCDVSNLDLYKGKNGSVFADSIHPYI